MSGGGFGDHQPEFACSVRRCKRDGAPPGAFTRPSVGQFTDFVEHGREYRPIDAYCATGQKKRIWRRVGDSRADLADREAGQRQSRA